MVHKHHIVPRHAGGSDDPSNLVELTVEDHAIAHKVLYHLWKREEDRIAWLMLSGRIQPEEARIQASRAGYHRFMESPEYVEYRKKCNKNLKPAPFKGKKMSETSKQKMSSAAKARPSNRIGIAHTEQAKEAMRVAFKGKTWKLDKETGKRVWL